MAGIFPTRARMDPKAFRLGYREVRMSRFRRLEGIVARGHEFHYSDIDPMPESVDRAYEVVNARGEQLAPEGYCLGNTLGGYIHLHFRSNPDFPRRFFGLTG